MRTRQHLHIHSHTCHLCLRTLSSAWALKKHMFTHNRRDTFACSHCAHTFITLRARNSHVRRVHTRLVVVTDAPVVVCEQCGEPFE